MRPQGSDRYVLVPTGDYADRFEAAMEAKEAIPSTCNGWGVGNSGRRYFEIHDSHPDKAIFMEIGQEQPLFDPESIVLTDIPLQTVRGELVIGHEVRTFTSCGDTMVYWVKDLTENSCPLTTTPPKEPGTATRPMPNCKSGIWEKLRGFCRRIRRCVRGDRGQGSQDRGTHGQERITIAGKFRWTV